MSWFTDNPTLGSGVLGSVSGLLGSALSAGMQAWEKKQTQNYNKEMYEMQKNDELAFWHMNNEYNLPSNQVSRLIAAGINPASQFGEGSVVGNSSSAPSAPSAPQHSGNNYSFIGDAFRSSAQMLLQSQLLQSQIDLNNANKRKTDADTDLTQEKIVAQIKENKAFDDMTQARLENIVSSTHLNLAQKESIVQTTSSTIALNDAHIEELGQRIQALKDEHSLLPYKTQQYLLEFEVKKSGLRQIEANIEKMAQEVKNLSAQEQLDLFELTCLRPLAVQMTQLGLSEKEVKVELEKVALELDKKELRWSGIKHFTTAVRDAIIPWVLVSGTASRTLGVSK